MEEVWKDIAGYEGLYQVSNIGNIKSLNFRGTKGKIQNLRHKLDRGGYRRVSLCSKDKKKKEHQVGRLVAQAFIPNPENKALIYYIDGDKANNTVENIQWITYQELGIRNYPSKNIVYNGKTFRTEKELANYYGLSEKNFNKRKRRGWTLEEILTIPVDKKNCCGKPYYYEYNGKYRTLKQISEITGVRLKTIHDRIYAGWDFYGACEIPTHKYKNRKEKK